jgi:hypothetical protein
VVQEPHTQTFQRHPFTRTTNHSKTALRLTTWEHFDTLHESGNSGTRRSARKGDEYTQPLSSHFTAVHRWVEFQTRKEAVVVYSYFEVPCQNIVPGGNYSNYQSSPCSPDCSRHTDRVQSDRDARIVVRDVGAHGSSVGWGAMLQAGMPRIRIPMRSLNLSNPSTRTRPWGLLSL